MITVKKVPFILGNGRIGASVEPNAEGETIDLFEESVWSGPYTDRCNSDASKSIKHIRTLLSHGRPLEAQERIFESFTPAPANQNYYCNAGKLHIDYYDGEHPGLTQIDGKKENIYSPLNLISRELDIQTGIASFSFSAETILPGNGDFSEGATSSSITYSREYFASATSDVMVVHISSSTPKTIYFRARLEQEGAAKSYSLSDDTIVMLNTTGIPYAAMVTAVTSGGSVFCRGGNLIVEKADDVTLYIDIETAYSRNHFRKKCGDVHKKPLSQAILCADIALKKICFASGTPFENLRTDHCTCFKNLKNCELQLENKEAEELWNLNMYKLISSSITSNLPALEKGIWKASTGNEKIRYKIDEIFSSFALAKTTAPELEKPLFNLARRLYKHGKKTADTMYGTYGYTCHNSTDIWGDTYSEGTALNESYNCLGSARIAKAVVDYYEFTLDKKFLRKNIHLVRDACRFYRNWFTESEGKLFINPWFEDNETKGKKLFIMEKEASDVVEIQELFEAALKAYKYAGVPVSSERYSEASAILSRLKSQKNSTASVSKKADFPESLNFKGFISSTADSIASSIINDDKLEITILQNPENFLNSGSVKNLALKGNILIDAEWENMEVKTAILHAKENLPYIRDAVIVYKNKKYPARITDGRIDLKNILPAAI